MFVTNEKGNSPAAAICLTQSVDNGLRTLSGGQYSIQVDGFLAVDQSVAPALVVEAAHSVRDVFAVLGTAADAAVQLQVNVNGSRVLPADVSRRGMIVSNSVAGFSAAAARSRARRSRWRCCRWDRPIQERTSRC